MKIWMTNRKQKFRFKIIPVENVVGNATRQILL